MNVEVNGFEVWDSKKSIKKEEWYFNSSMVASDNYDVDLNDSYTVKIAKKGTKKKSPAKKKTSKKKKPAKKTKKKGSKKK